MNTTERKKAVRKAQCRGNCVMMRASLLKYKGTPRRGQSTGDGGQAFEVAVKKAVECDHSIHVIATAYGTDFYKQIDGQRVYFECKCGLSTVGYYKLDDNFNPVGSPIFPALEKSDYMIYSPYNDYFTPNPEIDVGLVLDRAYVLPTVDFFNFIKTAEKDRRDKYNGEIIGAGKGIQIQMQVFTNSMKTPRGYGSRFIAFLEQYPTLREFLMIIK